MLGQESPTSLSHNNRKHDGSPPPPSSAGLGLRCSWCQVRKMSVYHKHWIDFTLRFTCSECVQEMRGLGHLMKDGGPVIKVKLQLYMTNNCFFEHCIIFYRTMWLPTIAQNLTKRTSLCVRSTTAWRMSGCWFVPLYFGFQSQPSFI